ncbi:MAG: hypothetical protein JO112_08485, partial [Planctomycetes bacterium]|nr:hypothetical protein [Planctomycetota bacterium]
SDVFPEAGTPTYWQAAAPGGVPRLALTALEVRTIHQDVWLSLGLLALFGLIWMLPRHPWLRTWVQGLWPEEMIVLGLLGWQLVGPAWAFLFLAALGLCGRLVHLGWWAVHWRRSRQPALPEAAP